MELQNFMGSISMNVVTPMIQMTANDESRGRKPESGIQKVRTRKMPVVVDNQIYYIPAISGESIRGILRRIAGGAVMRKIIENSPNNKTLNTDTIHLFIDGGTTKISKSLTFQEESEIREEYPFFSVFGAGLSISGKLAVQDALPVLGQEDDEKYIIGAENLGLDEVKYIRNLVSSYYTTKTDDILNHKSYIFDFMDKDELEEWEQTAKEVSEKRRMSLEKQKKNKNAKDNEEKEKKANAQHIQEVEFITPGTRLKSEISSLNTLTKAETGCIIYALNEFVTTIRRIGAFARKNYGLFDVQVDTYTPDSDKFPQIAAFRTVDKGNFLQDSTTSVNLNSLARESVEAFFDTITMTVKDVEKITKSLEKK